MCGIAGVCNLAGGFESEFSENVRKMTDSLRHRGPDDEGFLAIDSIQGKTYLLTGKESKVEGPRIENFSQPADLFLGHRRLSIIDLSSAGHQPMCNEDKQIWVVYNGEIFNYLEIRRELESLAHQFKSQTDTEVILHAYEEWGTDCLGRFNGMWAFVIVDLRKNLIFCSRDRLGIKPFYYTYDGKRFCFASEIKALLGIEGRSVEPNEQLVADYLFLGFLDHTEETLFRKVYQLKAGEYLLIQSNQLKAIPYWDIEPDEVRFSHEEDYADRFLELFQDSIRLRLRSDVTIGTCLSGGLDSSAIVCLIKRSMFGDQTRDRRVVGRRQKTFSSCFENPEYDERKYIELVLRQTGAEGNYVFPKVDSLHQDLSRLIWHQDEPFGSMSIHAQWEVMRLAKERGVTVLLDGQGADELFGGYIPSFYYLFSEKLRNRQWGGLWRELNGLRKYHGTKMLLDMMARWSIPRLSKWMGKRVDWAEGGFQKRFLRGFSRPSKVKNPLTDFLYRCLRSTTLPRLLHYEDRNSMAFSIEARLPFLDFRLVEYVFGLPSEQKIRNGVTKFALRQAIKGIVPEEVRKRSDKMGFVTPEDIWFRTVLKDEIHALLGSKSFAGRGYFVVDKAKQLFQEHCNGKRNSGPVLWRWINTELWFRKFIDGKRFSDG